MRDIVKDNEVRELNLAEAEAVNGGIASVIWLAYGAYRAYRAYSVVRRAVQVGASLEAGYQYGQLR